MIPDDTTTDHTTPKDSTPVLQQHRLIRIQLVNWGTFDGYHDLPVPRRGLLLTGDSGTGKSTLLDAMATLLVPPKWSSFNAAANQSGSGDRSRSIATYVRGAYGRTTDDATGQVTISHLRSRDAVWSAVALTYEHTDGRVTTLAQLFHLARHRHLPAEVSRLYLLAPENVDLLDVRPYAENGLAPQRIKADHSDWYHSSKYSSFGSRLQRRLGLGSDQALRLLHKTQSAKNLNNLNQLLRDFMLDEPSTFAYAAAAVDQFVELSQAHAAVVDARRQVECLEPLRQHVATHTESNTALAKLQQQSRHLDAHLLGVRTRLLTRDLETWVARASATAAESMRALEKARLAQVERDACAAAVVGIAGDLPALEQVAGARAERVDSVRRERDRIAGNAHRARLTLPDTAAGFAQWQEELRRTAGELDVAGAWQDLSAAVTRRSGLDDRERNLVRELASLEQQRSNLGAQLLEVRSQLCESLDVAPQRLRFAGELIDVVDEYADWQGAIERVLRPLAQTLLVPDDLYRALAAHVDAKWLRTRLVYARLVSLPPVDRPEPSEESLLHRIRVADGEQRQWLQQRLSEGFDYDCVGTVAELAMCTRGVTAAGQVKHGSSRHEKDDRSRIDDRTRWILGSSTVAKKSALEAALTEVRAALRQANAEFDRAQAARDELRDRRGLINELCRVTWAQIDTDSAEEALAQAQRAVAERLSTSSELVRATAALELADARLTEAQDVTRRCHTDHSDAQKRVTDGKRELARCTARLAEAEVVPEQVAASLDQDWEISEDSIDALDTTAARVTRGISERQLVEQGRRDRATGRSERVMQAYKNDWPERSADLAAEMAYAEEFLRRLDELEADGLPRFEERFFAMLQSQSRNNVGQLAHQLRAARREIRARIDPINESLARSPYAPGRFLQIKVGDRILPVVSDFLTALSRITSDSLADLAGAPEDAEGRRAAEERFDAMKTLLDRLASHDPADLAWRRQVLDTRQHVEFVARVVDPGGRETDVFTDSGGLSGGERQKLVTFCLVAALRYQLAREGALWPEYALVVLDEAFDKTDPTFTRAGLAVFREFGFQLLLATPMKMLQTLEDHVGGAAVVSMDADHRSRLSVLRFDADDAPRGTTTSDRNGADHTPAAEKRPNVVADPATMETLF
ncbi:ATP-binding protein [Granulicoccus phenolivorans]|uniref:ATP-binding protein n=1 Tax=Granulicoccus phenolivorans TaxID=266854 RepID=UPI00040FC112|nr:ATP-binding protein [Granulicoccus phenolivorans]